MYSIHYPAKAYNNMKTILNREYKRKVNVIRLLEDLLREEKNYRKLVGKQK